MGSLPWLRWSRLPVSGGFWKPAPLARYSSLLHKRNQTVHHDNHCDGGAELRHARNECENRGYPQEQGEEVYELCHEQLSRWLPLGWRKLISAVFNEEPRCFDLGEARQGSRHKRNRDCRLPSRRTGGGQRI